MPSNTKHRLQYLTLKNTGGKMRIDSATTKTTMIPAIICEVDNSWLDVGRKHLLTQRHTQ